MLLTENRPDIAALAGNQNQSLEITRRSRRSAVSHGISIREPRFNTCIWHPDVN